MFNMREQEKKTNFQEAKPSFILTMVKTIF